MFNCLLDALKQHGIELTITEARDLTAKYQMRGSPSNIHYKNFLKHFLLTLRPRDEGILERKIIHGSRIPVRRSNKLYLLWDKFSIVINNDFIIDKCLA